MKRISRFLIGLGLVALSLPLFMSSASAVTTSYTGLGEGLVVFGTTGPYEQAMVQNTAAGPMYCISINTEIYPGELYDEGSFADAIAYAPGGHLTQSALEQISRIVVNLYPNNNSPAPLAGDNNQKAASVQSAIWHFSNGWDLDPANPSNDGIVISNYTMILSWLDGDASNGELPAFAGEPAASLDVDPSAASAEVGELAGPFTVRIADGSSKVKVVVTNGTAVDSTGTALDPDYEYSNNEQFYIVKDAEGSATAEIAGNVATLPGTVFIPQLASRQLLIAPLAIAGESNASVEATFTEDPEDPTVGGVVVERPVSVAIPQVAGTSVSGELAATGVNGMSLAALSFGIALLALGLTLSSMKKLGEIHA